MRPVARAGSQLDQLAHAASPCLRRDRATEASNIIYRETNDCDRERKLALFEARRGDHTAGEGEVASSLARHDETVPAAALAQGGFIRRLDTMRRDDRCFWPPERRDQELIDGAVRTGDEHLHRSVAAVTHPAVEMQSPGLAGDKTQ